MAKKGSDPDTSAQLIATRKQIGHVFAVSDPMITRYLKQGMPKRGPAQYDVRECVQWMIDQVQQKGTTGNEIAKAQMELNQARTERVRIEIEKELGELIGFESARQALLTLASEIVGALDALPARTAPAILAADRTLPTVMECIRDECRAIRDELAGTVAELEDRIRNLGPGGEGDPAGAETDGGRVGGSKQTAAVR